MSQITIKLSIKEKFGRSESWSTAPIVVYIILSGPLSFNDNPICYMIF